MERAVIFLLFFYVALSMVHSQNTVTPKPKVLLRTIEAATNFPAFNRFIQKQGVAILHQQLDSKIPYIEVKANGKARYFGIGRVASYDYFYIEPQNEQQQKALLAKVVLSIFIYDVKEQQTVLKKDFFGIASIIYKEEAKISLVLLKKAFKQAAYLAACSIDIPLSGKILAVNAESITVDIGLFHSVKANDKLDVLDHSGKSIGFAEVLSSALKREQCKAYFPSSNSNVHVGDEIRLVATTNAKEIKEKVWEQEAIDETLQMRNVSFTKQNICPNPPLKLDVAISHNGNVIYTGKKARSLPVYINGFDAWEDEIVVRDNITWEPENWNIETSAKGEFLLKTDIYEKIKLHAIYTTSVTRKIITSQPTSLEVRHLLKLEFTTNYIALSLNEEQKLDIKAFYNNNEILSTEEIYSDLVWEYDTKKVHIENGHIRAHDTSSSIEIKVYSKSVPQISTYITVVILPSVQLKILRSKQAVEHNSIIVLDHKEEMRLSWEIKGITKEMQRYLEVKWSMEQPQWGELKYDSNHLFFLAGSKITNTPIKIVAEIKNVKDKTRKDTSAIIWIKINPPLLSLRFSLILIGSLAFLVIFGYLGKKIIQAHKPYPIPRKFNICYLEAQEKERYIYLISKKTIIIGRSSSCDIQIYHTNSHGKPNKELTNFISRKHCQLSLINNKIWLEKIAQTEKHNITIVNENKKIDTDIKHCIIDGDILKIGRLQLKINLWHNKDDILESMRLEYVNNPNSKEEYVVLFSKAYFGSGVDVPIRIKENIQEVEGLFLAEENHIFVQKELKKKQIFYSLFVNKQPRPLIAEDSFFIGKEKMTVKLEEE